MNLINNKPIVTDKGTQVTTCDASTQTDDFKITTKPVIKSIGTQIHPNSKDSAMQTSPPEVHSKNVERCIQSTPDVKNISKSHFQEKKGKSHGNGSQHQKIHRNYNNNNILVIGSSFLKSINTKDLNNTSVSTNRGARIVDIINIVKDKDIRQYESIIVHIGGNDISNGTTPESDPKRTMKVYLDENLSVAVTESDNGTYESNDEIKEEIQCSNLLYIHNSLFSRLQLNVPIGSSPSIETTEDLVSLSPRGESPYPNEPESFEETTTIEETLNITTIEERFNASPISSPTSVIPIAATNRLIDFVRH
ncbi:unnamed protein product [Mytilus coruscus]|uniref:Uncharacterized protein n=1 Tax=Mytilus coruscus TaxID=42192 RepID=A0A6J8BST7_MYTCO|nr:unnamed protein product [Mytilus coruscus]